jgi:hypothetical protein
METVGTTAVSTEGTTSAVNLQGRFRAHSLIPVDSTGKNGGQLRGQLVRAVDNVLIDPSCRIRPQPTGLQQDPNRCFRLHAPNTRKPDKTMKEALHRLANRPRPPRPWRDGRQIAWQDPTLSSRLLPVHLDPTTHMASRSPAVIAEHVAWLQELLSAEPLPDGRARHLVDLGCGPGLYAVPLARAGLRVTGIDFSPAAVVHARNLAMSNDLKTIDILEMDLLHLPHDLPQELAPINIITF